MKYEIISGIVRNLTRDSFSQTSGSIKNGKGKIETKIKTISTFKLENLDKMFRYEGDQLIENGDKIAFITTMRSKGGYFKIFSMKNFSKVWLKRNGFGLTWLAILFLWLFLTIPIAGLMSGRDPFLPYFITVSIPFVIILIITYMIDSKKRLLFQELKTMEIH